MPKIIVHCLVGNEERFVWYALQSVLPYVDRILVWDTSSVDKTAEIIKSIKSAKINFRQVGKVDAVSHTQLRQQMLEATPAGFDWLMILDGDEVWPRKNLEKVVNRLGSEGRARAVAVRTRNWVGDVYHYQPPEAGHYWLAGQRGHLALRFISLHLPRLAVVNPHGGQAYTTAGRPVQELLAPALQFIDTYYYHATHLPRSSADNVTLKRRQKYKLELGLKVRRAELPGVLFAPRPAIVPEVTVPMSPLVRLMAAALTGPRLLRRRFLPVKEGYI